MNYTWCNTNWQFTGYMAFSLIFAYDCPRCDDEYCNGRQTNIYNMPHVPSVKDHWINMDYRLIHCATVPTSPRHSIVLRSTWWSGNYKWDGVELLLLVTAKIRDKWIKLPTGISITFQHSKKSDGKIKQKCFRKRLLPFIQKDILYLGVMV